MFPKHYSLKKDEKDHFVIHDKRDGKEFKVAKKGLHPANELKILRHVQKFEDGGEVEGYSSGITPWSKREEPESMDVPSSGADTEAFNQKILAQKGLSEQAPMETATPPPMPEAPAPQMQAPAPQQAVPQQPPPATPQMIPGMPTVQGLQGMQGQFEKAIKSGMEGQQAQNQQIAQAYEDKINVQERAFSDYQNAMHGLQAQSEKMAQDIAGFKVDPERFWNSKSDGSKFGTAISVMLGGLGAGLQGTTHNAAMEVLQKSIDRDIESQKLELGKKQTLLSDNFRAQGNLAAAEAATRAQYEAMFQGKLAQLVAKTNNPMLAAQAQQQIMDSRLKMMQYLQPVAQNQMVMQMRASLQQAAQAGTKINANPEEFIPIIVPEAHQKEALAEVKRARDTQHGMQFAMQAFEDMVNQVKSVKTLGGLIQPEARTRLESAILPTVQDLEGSVRQTAMDYAKKAYIPTLDDVTFGRVDGKRKALREYFKSKSAAPTFEAYAHVPLTSFAGTAPVAERHQNEGQTASDAKGNRIVMKNGQWVPLGR
jgi:hypothetical protein